MAPGDETGRVFTDSDFLDDPQIEVREFGSGRGKVLPVGQSSWSGWEAPLMAPFRIRSEDGLEGWCVRVPGNRPLATPAVSNGRVFVGGGFGSHEFYAFDAESGRPAWQLRTGDDGPTAAVVSGNRVAFNTESCTLYVVDADTGHAVWEKWLGDPLLAQPAVAGDAVVMVYPDRSHAHRVACFGLHDGALRWENRVNGDVITAPVFAEGSIHLATLDGTLYRFDAGTGREIWARSHKATSAPWIHRGEIYVSLRETAEGRAGGVEGIDSIGSAAGQRRRATSSSRRVAEYLRYKAMAAKEAKYASMDAGVGFTTAPGAAKLHMAEEHLGIGRVSSMWAYQGSRPEVFDDGIFSVMDDVVQRLDLRTHKPHWRRKMVADDRDAVLGRVLNPPAVTARNLYLTSGLGDVVALDRSTGDERRVISVPGGIMGQPSLAGGRIYLGTADGMLFSFAIEDTDPTGWPMWGGGAGHNGAG